MDLLKIYIANKRGILPTATEVQRVLKCKTPVDQAIRRISAMAPNKGRWMRT